MWTHRAVGKELKVKMASDTGGRRVLSNRLHSSISGKANSTGFSYFRIYNGKSPPPLFPPSPQRENLHSFPQLTYKFLEGERGRVYIALYPARETPPCFSATPLVAPHPSLVVGPPQQQRLQPQPRRCLIAPASRSQQQELPRPGEEMHRIDTATAEAQQQQRKYLIAP